jgi:hypothetical protein
MYLSPRKRNLEQIDRDLHAGAWRISALLDPITEKKFRLFSLKSRAPVNFSPAVLSYRCECAHLIAGERCPAVLSLSSESDRVDILTPWFDLVPMERLDESEFAACFDALLRTLAMFDNHSFFATELLPEAIGRNETGDWALLPPAYAIPLRVDTRPTSPGRRSAENRTPAVAVSFEHPPESRRIGHHAVLIGEFVSRFCQPVLASTVRDGPSSFRSRLSQTAHSIALGDLAPTCEIYETLFGTRLDERFRPTTRIHEERDIKLSIRDQVERILARISEEGSVTLLEGPSHSGKTRIMSETARLLRERGEFDVFVLDEWDLYARTRPRLAPAGRSAPSGKQPTQAVWLIDDIDDKALASSDFSRSMIESDSYPRGAVVLSVQSVGVSKETTEFLGKLEAQRGARCERIILDGEEKHVWSVSWGRLSNASIRRRRRPRLARARKAPTIY